jgi:GNAT superfamily N-acetyltransferase
MNSWIIERLEKRHDRGEFSCGQPSLDHFIRNLVSQYEKRKLGRTYVALRAGERRVYGYYTLASSCIFFERVPQKFAKKLPRHSVPVILLARLAVDHSVQQQGLGKLLLQDALTRCLQLSTQLGIHAVEVEAIDSRAKDFYEKHGFISLNDDPLHLFLPLTTIEQASEP